MSVFSAVPLPPTSFASRASEATFSRRVLWRNSGRLPGESRAPPAEVRGDGRCSEVGDQGVCEEEQVGEWSWAYGDASDPGETGAVYRRETVAVYHLC